MMRVHTHACEIDIAQTLRHGISVKVARIRQNFSHSVYSGQIQLSHAKY